jgi:hypothetical protein
MLPVEHGSGQLLHSNHYLCDTLYEIDYPLGFTNLFRVRRLRMTPQNHDPAALLALANLTLVTADGTQHQLPPSLEMKVSGMVECTINLPA